MQRGERSVVGWGGSELSAVQLWRPAAAAQTAGAHPEGASRGPSGHQGRVRAGFDGVQCQRLQAYAPKKVLPKTFSCCPKLFPCCPKLLEVLPKTFSGVAQNFSRCCPKLFMVLPKTFLRVAQNFCWWCPKLFQALPKTLILLPKCCPKTVPGCVTQNFFVLRFPRKSFGAQLGAQVGAQVGAHPEDLGHTPRFVGVAWRSARGRGAARRGSPGAARRDGCGATSAARRAGAQRGRRTGAAAWAWRARRAWRGTGDVALALSGGVQFAPSGPSLLVLCL